MVTDSSWTARKTTKLKALMDIPWVTKIALKGLKAGDGAVKYGRTSGRWWPIRKGRARSHSQSQDKKVVADEDSQVYGIST